MSLLDKIFGRNNLENELPNPLTREIAVRTVMGGNVSKFLNYLPDPDPVLRKLGKSSEILDDLLSDDHVFSVVSRRKNGVERLQWQFAAEEDDQDHLEFIQQIFDDLAENGTKIGDLISQSLNPIFYGISVFEIVWQKQGKYLVPVKIDEKPREWFAFDNNGNVYYRGELYKEKLYITGKDAPAFAKYKFVVLRNKPTYQNPYGIRALSRVFWPVSFKRGGLKFWAVFVEKYGMPYVFGKLPRGASEEAHKDLLDKLENMVADGIGTMPDDSSVEVLDAKKSAQGEIYEKFIAQMDRAISKAILTNTLSTELQGEGSRAATETHREAELSLADSDKFFTKELFDGIIRRIIDVNFGDKKYPYFTDIKPQGLNKEKAERDKTLSEVGVKFTKNYFIKNYGLEEDDFDLSEPNAQASPAQFAEKTPEKPQSFVPDELANALSDKELQTQIEETLKPILTLVKNGENYETVMEKLAETFPAMKTESLEKILEKLIFVAELSAVTSDE